MRRKKLIVNLIIFLCANFVYSQEYLYQSKCFIGNEVIKEKVDTLTYKVGFDLAFIQNNLDEFQPSYFNYVKLNRKAKKPIFRKLLNGNLIEFYDSENKLVKYTYFEDSGNSFNVEIKYLESGNPYMLIEYFLDEHHSENGIFSIQYILNYNDDHELIEIESLDGYGYECKFKRM